jgi:uncharacterized damage-inducible protein DinB
MPTDTTLLKVVFDGWDTYHTSILNALEPLSQEQLQFRPSPGLRTAGEVAAHIGLGRISWFQRIDAPRSKALSQETEALESPASVHEDKEAILYWLDASWQMISETLDQWTVADLSRTYLHEYWGKTYRVSHQWTIWRILAHDMHHGGELALLLGMQGVATPELGDLGGHLTEPPLA